ncbi:uncharacterized protein PHACADRAFT_249882 [Phanerochaete carnosa HHB-10118-sp]|uniref:Protein YTP1-like C-terminal domain-containing protein n=1 Tax=Phanerochaete carnosa (strain HHB-10118-sp) TaxID=650164 RepID=K5V9B9_PHACS|nr:uncharacterized protein PHACADRAFT_249882 [Phanerochaete carnosa HHB-10118-sp]EKM59411.1 hypothetical protein PHACADRAFT_249882 [Phanerochaete carnosa HHB-10118-sp]
MRAQRHVLLFLVPAFAAALAFAAPSTDDFGSAITSSQERALVRRHGDMHENMHAAPVIELNETKLLMYHQPTPPSYYTIDFEDDSGAPRYPGFMILHILFMSLAFFGALPVGIALRSVKHAWHGLTVVLFWAFVVLGLASNGIYRKLTPDMYEGQTHGSQGYFVLFVAAAISALDLIALGGRLVSYIRSIRSGEESFTFKSCWNTVVLDREAPVRGVGAEYTGLASEEPEEPEDYETVELKAREVEDDGAAEPIHVRRAQSVVPIDSTPSPRSSTEDHAQWANNAPRHAAYPQDASSDHTMFERTHSQRGSVHSDETLQDNVHSSLKFSKIAILKMIGRGTFATVERTLVFAGYFQLITGIVIYTGGCRQNYTNGCLAHLIKGGIFWCYGLATFGRFLGSFSELGWAWNRAPSGNYPSAEFTESFVIFLYGITNTWMERFGAHPGDPFTTKEVQHISIAVMYWFAGLIGMAIESKRVRRWLASSATAALPKASRSQEAVAEPPSYIASFNPFPALCIGITGAAMAAHFQEYLFQVQIHQLWGNLLTAFAVLRCVTYFFLWLGPPRSILPSRPPTEALASFFLSCGGLVFQFSTEEVTIAAMRRGHDDMMMFLNVAVAVTCFAFCWALCIVAFKGWLKSHSQRTVKFHSSA